jgi:hypothetical protein
MPTIFIVRQSAQQHRHQNTHYNHRRNSDYLAQENTIFNNLPQKPINKRHTAYEPTYSEREYKSNKSKFYTPNFANMNMNDNSDIHKDMQNDDMFNFIVHILAQFLMQQDTFNFTHAPKFDFKGNFEQAHDNFNQQGFTEDSQSKSRKRENNKARNLGYNFDVGNGQKFASSINMDTVDVSFAQSKTSAEEFIKQSAVDIHSEVGLNIDLDKTNIEQHSELAAHVNDTKKQFNLMPHIARDEHGMINTAHLDHVLKTYDMQKTSVMLNFYRQMHYDYIQILQKNPNLTLKEKRAIGEPLHQLGAEIIKQHKATDKNDTENRLAGKQLSALVKNSRMFQEFIDESDK